ncbi:MAG: transglutaminase family protein [Pseudomonadaceae bacterium]|nr:MAG: transglutaminase family protein [Pseudomonadaceae bacterium]
MVRLEISIALAYEVLDTSCDLLLNIHPAITASQQVASESITINQPLQHNLYIQGDDGTRLMRLQAARGPLQVHYQGVVDIQHIESPPDVLMEMAVADLPLELFSYIYPSRYCQSDRFLALANHEFGSFAPGYYRVLAIRDWVKQRTRFVKGSTAGSTSAIDTLVDHIGVCRDFAHLMIAVCRALNIPARFVSGIDYGADPSMGPTDFHAYVEVFLSDRWYLFDPTGISPTMGLLRLGTGRDAADVSFATVFGAVIATVPPVISIVAVEDHARGFRLPVHQAMVLSTAGKPVCHYLSK